MIDGKVFFPFCVKFSRVLLLFLFSNHKKPPHTLLFSVCSLRIFRKHKFWTLICIRKEQRQKSSLIEVGKKYTRTFFLALYFQSTENRHILFFVAGRKTKIVLCHLKTWNGTGLRTTGIKSSKRMQIKGPWIVRKSKKGVLPPPACHFIALFHCKKSMQKRKRNIFSWVSLTNSSLNGNSKSAISEVNGSRPVTRLIELAPGWRWNVEDLRCVFT